MWRTHLGATPPRTRFKPSSSKKFDWSRLKSNFIFKSWLQPAYFQKLISTGWSQIFLSKVDFSRLMSNFISPQNYPVFFSIFCVLTSAGWSRLFTRDQPGTFYPTSTGFWMIYKNSSLEFSWFLQCEFRNALAVIWVVSSGVGWCRESRKKRGWWNSYPYGL